MRTLRNIKNQLSGQGTENKMTALACSKCKSLKSVWTKNGVCKVCLNDKYDGKYESFFNTNKNYRKLVDRLSYEDGLLLIKVVHEAQMHTLADTLGRS